MKREFLEGLGLEKDIIDQIMTENGNDINREKAKADEYKSQLDTAKETLKSFEGVDVKDLQGQITKLNSDLAAKDADYQAKIADMEFSSVLDAAISGSKAKNVKAVRALLDIDTLKASKNQSEDIKKAIEEVKTANDYLFEGTNIPGGGGNPPGGGAGDDMAAIRAAMGLKTN